MRSRGSAGSRRGLRGGGRQRDQPTPARRATSSRRSTWTRCSLLHVVARPDLGRATPFSDSIRLGSELPRERRSREGVNDRARTSSAGVMGRSTRLLATAGRLRSKSDRQRGLGEDLVDEPPEQAADASLDRAQPASQPGGDGASAAARPTSKDRSRSEARREVQRNRATAAGAAHPTGAFRRARASSPPQRGRGCHVSMRVRPIRVPTGKGSGSGACGS